MQEEEIITTESLIEKLKAEKDSGFEYQERKHEDWTDNYELFRGKVRTNRLTQRQAVNIPLMKETIKTLISKVDDAPNVDWKENGGDEDKEILYQEIWDSNVRENKLELIDIIDKKSVLLYGISTKKLNIGEKGVEVENLDVYDVLFDPLMKVGDVESARFIIHQNIFRSAREILADDRYEKKAKDELKIWLNSAPGITQAEHNREAMREKMERLEAMGVEHEDFPLFAGGDRLVNLTEHYTTMWNSEKKDWERRVVVYADNEVILLDETLEDLIGIDLWPFVTWVEDPESTDIYSDSVADLIRVPNKIINVWFSQLIENRTLKNFQMHWFLPSQGYTPQTYNPGPGVMLPAPPGEDINKVIKPVEISGLDDTMAAIQALTNIVERGTGATAIDKGQAEKGVQTLGEVEILVGKSVERALSMTKFYRMAWYETAFKWDKLMHANAPKILRLYKQGRSGRVYTKKVMAADWKSSEGYEPIVTSSSEQEQNEIQTIQKYLFVRQQFPDNPALASIIMKRSLELLDLTPEELKQVEEAEGQKQAQAQQTPQQQVQPSPEIPTAPQPADTGVLDEIDSLMSELQT